MKRLAAAARLIHDEEGKPSTARIAFWITLAVTLTLCILDAVRTDVTVPTAAYSLLGTLVLALSGWAGGPRVMQYIGPQLGRVAQGIASAERPIVRDFDNPDDL